MIPDHLRIQLGQEALTPEQETEARRFANERITTQLSPEPVGEQVAEAWLRRSYQVVGLAPPRQILWLDGPVALEAQLAPQSEEADRWRRVWHEEEADVWHRLWTSVYPGVEARVKTCVGARVVEQVDEQVWFSVFEQVERGVGARVWANLEHHSWSIGERIWTGVGAYFKADWLAFYHFFATYLADNELHALAHFNELAAGYLLGQDQALLVRRPHRLERDITNRLHSATGRCLEYPDGWGFYAWHGVEVSENIILAPEQLTRWDFLGERNLEVRRVIQERMGSRFVLELGGIVLDAGPRGTLYEVRLPDDDPERVARYVQVQDAASSRRYFLRVPPTLQTAAEAVAWTFQVAAEDYRPAQET